VPYFWLALIYVGFGLEAALVFVLFRRGRREFPLFFSYICARLAASVVISSYFLVASNRSNRMYAVVYWVLDLGLHALVISLLATLIRFARGKTSSLFMIAGTATMAGALMAAMVLPYDPRFGYWMTGAVRNLSFCEETLNFILWTLLLRHTVAPRVLWVSAGLGIQVTGEVMGHSLRLLSSRAALWAPDVLINVCEIMALAIWLYGSYSRTDERLLSGVLPSGGLLKFSAE
jgi:hypothetical protein